MNKLNFNRILLVHPLGYPAAAAREDISRMANLMPPLGLASIAAYLDRQNIEGTIVDCFARPDSDRLIRENLLTRQPAWIGISCTTSSFLDGVRIAKLAKGILPGIRVVFGGAHVSAMKEKILEAYSDVDFVIVGEGEQTLAELLQSRACGPETLPGLIYRTRSGGVNFTGYRKKGIELDKLPFPAYEKLAGYPQAYSLPIFNYPKAPNTSCISSRGCPYACSYCDRSVFRRTFRYNSAAYLYEHLRYLKERFGIRHINFYDDQFTFNRQRVEDFTRLMIDRPLQITFNCAVRAEHIDRPLLEQMQAAGCWMISLGIETGDENLLAQHRQHASLEMLAEKIHLIKQTGIRTKGLMMIGLPGETEASIQKSRDFVFSLPVDDFNLSKFTPFPGSPLYESIHDVGTFEEDWEKMDCMHFVFIPSGMTKEELQRCFKEFYKAHFLRPCVLWGYVTMLWKSTHSWIRFIRNLSHFMRFAATSKRKGSEDPSSGFKIKESVS